MLGTSIVDELVQLRYSNGGGYVQGQWQVEPRLSVTAGLRGDANSRYGGVVNPRLGLVSRLTKHTTVKALFGTIAPVLFQFLADLDWERWSVSPRLVATGAQRGIALDTTGIDRWRRHTIDGYATVDLTVRRERVAGPLDLFVRVDNLSDARYRNLNLRAFSNPEELEGSPQNPRRITVGFDLRFD